MLTVTPDKFLYEDGEAWVAFTRRRDGTVAVDSFLEVSMSATVRAELAIWLGKPLAEADHA